jgi:hypothetical protein
MGIFLLIGNSNVFILVYVHIDKLFKVSIVQSFSEMLFLQLFTGQLNYFFILNILVCKIVRRHKV